METTHSVFLKIQLPEELSTVVSPTVLFVLLSSVKYLAPSLHHFPWRSYLHNDKITWVKRILSIPRISQCFIQQIYCSKDRFSIYTLLFFQSLFIPITDFSNVKYHLMKRVMKRMGIFSQLQWKKGCLCSITAKTDKKWSSFGAPI